MGLTANEDSIILRAFRLIPKDNYAYIAIHGDNTGFKIFEDNLLKPLKTTSLAKWIASNTIYNGRTIVLLSCNDSVSTQKLTSALYALDLAAKLKPRKIIAWSGRVTVFENGLIQGLGTCKLYQKTSSTADVSSSFLATTPTGTGATATGKKVKLGGLDLNAEEAAGGHSLARHGSHLTLSDMQQRAMGIHPTLRQSRAALRFKDRATHDDAVDKAYAHCKTDIDAHFAAGGGYDEWVYDYGSLVGEGYRNTGSLRSPTLIPVTAQIVTITFHPDASNPRGYRLESAFPTD